MDEKSLSNALGDSLKEDTIVCIGDLVEVGLDDIMDDCILKDIPIISTAISLYKIGNSLLDRHYLRKLAIFLDEFNKGLADNVKRWDYIKKLKSNEKFRNQEIEYLLVLIARYISYDKPKILAKLYLSYWDEIIIWEELTMYATVIDLLFPEDIKVLCSFDFDVIKQDDDHIDSVLRLLSVGIVSQNVGTKAEHDESTGTLSINDKIGYTFTKFGKKFKDIIMSVSTEKHLLK